MNKKIFAYIFDKSINSQAHVYINSVIFLRVLEHLRIFLRLRTLFHTLDYKYWMTMLLKNFNLLFLKLFL